MLIENVDSLKQWLVQKLAPICDAEPTALAKYVCALVRKDKPESELREICSDQLDVFLQQKTKPFVDDLFIGLKTKEYESVVVKPVSATSTPTPTPVVTPAPTPVKVEVMTEPAVPSSSPSRTASQSASASSTQSKVSSGEPSHKRVKKSEESSQSQSWTSVPVKPEAPPDGRESREGRDAREGRDPRDRDGRDDREPRERRDSDRREGDRRDNRDVRDRRRRTRSRSFSPRRRDIDERRRRYDDRDRGRFSPERRYSPDRRYRRRSRSRSPRRYRISPERRGRSRSPRERDLRDKLNRRSRSWSRPRSRSRSRGRVEPDSRGSTPTQDNGHYPAVVTSNPSLPSLVSISHKPLEPPPPGEGPPLIMPGPGGPPGSGPPPGQPRLRGQNMRCQSFDEKGFCMLGDLCPYDHGMDPVVVEDIGIPNVLSFPPPPAGHPLPPPPVSLSIPPPRPGFPPPGMNVPPPGALIRPPGPPRPPRPPVEPYQPEGYNPEAPGLTPSSARTPFWASHPPSGVPPGPFPLPPDAMNVPPPQRQSDLVTVHTLMGKDEDQADTDSRSSPPTVASRVVMPSKRTHTEMEGGPMRMTEGGPMRMEGGPMRMSDGGPMRMSDGGPMRMMDGGPMRMMEGGPMRMMDGGGPMRIVQRPHFNPRHGFGGPRKHFDFKRLGGFQRQQFKQTNTTLEVRKIPPEMNNIAKLNEHFGKFGTLTNIQVKFEGDPGAALISYSRNDEAASAYHSSEPVFNNRFIKLFWHRPGANQAPNSGPGFNPTANAAGDGGAGGGGMEKTKTEGEAGQGGILNRLGPFNQPTNDLSISEYDPEESSTEAVSSTSQDASSKPQSVVRQTVIPPAHKLSLNNMTKAGPRTPTDQSIVYTTSLGHLRKTVFNQQVTKARAAVAPKFSPTTVGSANFVSRIEAIKKNEELKKEAIVKKAELDKKKQVLLEQQVAQQKLLLDKLERGKTTLTLEEKTNIMKMLKVVSDSIDKLKFKSGTPMAKKLPPAGSHKLVNTPTPAGSHKLVNTPTPSPTVAATTSTSPAVTGVQQTVKRDILDTELDLMTKQGTGEDTSVLRHRLVELTQQAASMGLLGRGRGLARGRGSGPWWQGGRGRGGGSMTLDKRPKTLEVRGFLPEDLDEVKAHFALFGDIVQTELKEDIPCLMLTFANRKQAESAYAAGARFKKRALSVRWHMGQVHLNTEADIAAAIPSDQTDDADTEEDELQVTIGGETEETMDDAATSLDEVPGELDEVPDTLDEVPDTLEEVPDTLDEVPDTLDEAAINPDEEVDDVLVSLDEDMDERILLAPDEEEDDDADNRSWRR